MVAVKQGYSMATGLDSSGQSLPLPSKLLARLHECTSVFSSESHNKAVSLAIRERKLSGPGFSQKMNSLFCLWSNRLREAFHTNTYLMFVRLAQEDAIAGDAYGMECLFRFLSYGLERRFRQELFLDFEDLALAQYKSGDLYGVEKYAAFWHYGGSKVVPSDITTNTKLMHLIKVKYPTLSAFKDSRYVAKEDPEHVPEVLTSHLGVEVPASPARSTMAFSEFSFDFENHEDIMIASSPPSTSLLSASAPSFYPLGPARWGQAGGASGLLPSVSLGYVRVHLTMRAIDNTVAVRFTVDGKPVGAATAPQPVQRSSSEVSSWSAARAARRTSGTGSAFSGSVPRDSSSGVGSDGMFGRSPPFGSGRATTAARPVGQPWKGARGAHNRRGPATRNDTSSQELGASLGASPTVTTPIGMSPVGFSNMSSLRGGMRGGGRSAPRGEHISVWPSNWNHKGRDGQRKHGGKSGAGSASSSWTGKSRAGWGGRENESDNPRSVLVHGGSGVPSSMGAEHSSSIASCAGAGGGEFSGAAIVTGAEPLEAVEFHRKSPSPHDSDASQMTDCSGYAPDHGAEAGLDDVSGDSSLKQKCSTQVRCAVAGSAALEADLSESFGS